MKYKQVIVVREDLKLSPGKLAVQVAHASVGIMMRYPELESLFEAWFNEGQRKIVLRAPDISLDSLCYKAEARNIPLYLVKDFGLTELEPDTITCLGIGPALEEDMNKIVGNLKLYRGD